MNTNEKILIFADEDEAFDEMVNWNDWPHRQIVRAVWKGNNEYWESYSDQERVLVVSNLEDEGYAIALEPGYGDNPDAYVETIYAR